MRFGGSEIGGVRADCPEFTWRAGTFVCPAGRLRLPGAAAIPFSLSIAAGSADLELRLAAGERWRLRRHPGGRIELEVDDGRLERLRAFLPPPLAGLAAGRLRARLDFDGDRLHGEVKLAGAAFADSSGLHAGEGLGLDADISARRRGAGWTWRAEARWQAGEIYWQPLYLKSAGQTLVARGSLDERSLNISDARLDLPGIGEVAAGGEWDRRAGRLSGARLESAGIELEGAARALLSALLVERGAPEMDLAGRLSFSLDWDGGGLRTGNFGLAAVSVHDRRGRFSAEGIHGGLPWQRDGTAQGHLSVAKASAGGLGFGAFTLPIEVGPERLALARSEIPLLGSELVLERLLWQKSGPGGAWEGELGVALHPVSLPALTQAIGLPRMSGTLSASFPGLRYRDGSAFLDGALVIQVFDGYLNCTRLRLDDLFGPVPRLSADIDARHLDLGLLTDTFSFGRIEGFVDVEVTGLELAAWKPQRFDARIASSPGDYRRRISRRAVQDIAALGGGPGAAIQAGILRLFEQFGYRRLGLSCRLRNGVCAMEGIAATAGGFVIVEGGGIPALTAIGYNHLVDWPVLIDRLQAVIRDNVRPVIQ